MSSALQTGKGGATASTIHLEFIQNQASLGDDEGRANVEAYHRALFLHHHAADLERFQQQGRIHEDRLTHLDQQLKDTRARLQQMNRLVPVTVDGVPDVQPTAPWNLWDRVMFFAALAGILALLVFGVLNISFNLLESGLVTFVENPIRAYFWAALLPVGALAVKVGWDSISSARGRDLYLWLCLGLGLAGVLSWVAAYASVYPTLSKTTEEHLASLRVQDPDPTGSVLGPGGAKRIDMVIVTSQAVAEVFLSAVLGMYMTLLYARHRPVRLASNPEFQQLEESRLALEENVARERSALADARGNASRLEHQLTAFIAFAQSMFDKEAAMRRDLGHNQRRLLDQISQQLKDQLDLVARGGARGTDLPQSTIPSVGGNGR